MTLQTVKLSTTRACRSQSESQTVSESSLGYLPHLETYAESAAAIRIRVLAAWQGDRGGLSTGDVLADEVVESYWSSPFSAHRIAHIWARLPAGGATDRSHGHPPLSPVESRLPSGNGTVTQSQLANTNTGFEVLVEMALNTLGLPPNTAQGNATNSAVAAVRPKFKVFEISAY